MLVYYSAVIIAVVVLSGGFARKAQAQMPSDELVQVSQGESGRDDEAPERGETRERGEPQDAAERARDAVSQAVDGASEAQEREVADAELEGERVYQIDFHCDLPVCRNPVEEAKLQDISGLYVGMRFSRQSLRLAERRLAKTGFFEELRLTTRLDKQGVRLRIRAHGAVLIRNIDFIGVDGAPFETDLRKLLIYRRAQMYQENETRATTQVKTLETEFEKFGFFGTRIKMYVRPVEDESHLVDLVFDIKKGRELEICEIGIRGLRTLTYDQAREYLLSGHSFFVRRLGLSTPKFTTDLFKEGQDALVRHYRSLGFFQARIVGKVARQHPERGCVEMLVDVSEGPRWAVDFRGDLEVSAADLRAELPFYDSGFVDSEEISRAEDAIRRLYETRGYPFTQVFGNEERLDGLDRELVFDIDAGPRLQIEEIVLHGNEHFSSKELLENFQTRVFGLLTEGGYLQGEQLLGDMAALEEFYHTEGFLAAQVTRFELEILHEARALRIHIFLDEGELTRVHQVRFEGNRTLTDGLLGGQIKIHSGDPIMPLQIRADRSRLVQRYTSYGYPMVDVETTCQTLDGRPVDCDAPQRAPSCAAVSLEDLDARCTWREGEQITRVCPRVADDLECRPQGGIQTDQVRVVHRITEGPFIRVGEILLKGNFKTVSDLIYQELPLKSDDVFDVGELLKGQGNMRSLGVFDSVSVEAIGLDEQAQAQSQATAALLISVEESDTRHLDFKFGFEGRDLLADARRLLVTGETQYKDDNLFGRAQRFRPRVIGAFDTLQLFRLGTESAGLASAQPVTELDYLVGTELIYEHPRFLKSVVGVDKLSLTVAPFYLLDLLGVSNENVLREEWGLRAELRKELVEVLERLYLSFGIEGKQGALWTPADPMRDGRRIFSPRRITGKLIPEVTLDRRDSPLNPREGFYVQVQPAIVSGATHGQGGEDPLKDSYLRLAVHASYYLRFLEELVFAQGISYGHIVPFIGRSGLVTEDERFRLGGAASVRGFRNNSLGPLRQDVPSGGEFMMNYSAELRYPLIREISLYGAVFFDAGLLVDCFSSTENTATRIGCYEDAFGGEHPLDEIRTAAGLGIRYLIVDQIPLVFDYGIVLDRRPGEDFGTLNFNLGYSF